MEVFVVNSRDEKGNGNDDSDSKHKDFILYSTDGATDIVNTAYTNYRGHLSRRIRCLLVASLRWKAPSL